jgi:hypothetical protein
MLAETNLRQPMPFLAYSLGSGIGTAASLRQSDAKNGITKRE